MTIRWLMAGYFLFAVLPTLAQDAPNNADAVLRASVDPLTKAQAYACRAQVLQSFV